MTFPSDLKIAQSARIRPIVEIGEKLGISENHLIRFGNNKAKIPLELIEERKVKKSNLILVTAMTPTPAGEGKTTTSIGLCEGLNKIGANCTVVLREPSLGPVFGIKGGAAGGGYSQVIPMEDINLHFTGDFSAIEKANNLLSALIDNNLHHYSKGLGIDSRTVVWKRVIDMNDRSLRNIVVGLGGVPNGVPREDGFNITSASEIMAILCMSKNRDDLKSRMGNIFVGYTWDKKPVYARDLKAEKAMAILLKDAILPNLVQTLEGNPAIIHGGPFANIAQGTNSIIATKMGMSHSDYVVTEAGFGSDLGAEKFLNIKCVEAGLKPSAVVIVATIRALKYHGGVGLSDLKNHDVKAVELGMPNLEKHIENMKEFGLLPVVAVNHFVSDTDEEVNCVIECCDKMGIKAVVSKGWELGGEGMTDLAREIKNVVENGHCKFKPLYERNSSLKEKIARISTTIYSAGNVEYSKRAKQDIEKIEKLGLDKLPICMAKTQKSFSDNEKLLGRPEGHTLHVREIEIAAGAGFLIPITGKMMRMPGLPSTPASEFMDIDADGNISGLS